MQFKAWLGEADNLVQKWQAMRQAAGWKAPNKPVTKIPKIPRHVMTALEQGFRSGGLVQPVVVQILGLDGVNYSLVADSSQFTTTGAYPFYKEKRAGTHTGRFMYTPNFQFSRFLEMI